MTASASGLRWGILGTGGIARAFTSDLLLTGRPVSAVGSRTQATADAFAAEYGVAKAHGSYADLVADDTVDAVYIGTPHPMHAANATLALEAGKHVLVEKPFTLNAAEARAVADLAAAKGLVALEAMWTRWLPHMVRVREIVAEGTLGELRSLTADHTQSLSDAPEHRINALELGGGALLDLGIYPISFTWDIFGAPETVQASATFKQTGADAQVATIFGYADGRIATSYSASTTRGPNVAALLGTRGRLEIDQVWYSPTDFRVYNERNEVVETYHSEVEGRGMQYQAAELERLVSAGQLSGEILPIEQTVAIMGCLDTIRDQIGLRYPME